jgi:hypothetical protein
VSVTLATLPIGVKVFVIVAPLPSIDCAGQFAFGQIPVRPPNEIKRLSDRSGHDPLARRRFSCSVSNSTDDFVVGDSIADVDEWRFSRGEMQKMRVSVDQSGQDGGAVQVQSFNWFRCEVA